jgi:glutathione S-transferase
MAPLTLYDAARCPFCARTRITLAEKGIEYETVEIDLADRPAWIYEKNPKGRVPVLEIPVDGGTWPLPESAVIGEYLEDRFPDPPLLPADGEERASARLLVHRFDDFSKPYYALRRGETGARDRFNEELAVLDRLLESTGWLSGQAFGLADIAYLPWVLRARDLLDVSLTDLPRLSDWVQRACGRPSVAAEVEVVAAL